MKKTLILITIGFILFNGKPTQESKPIRELDIVYFLDNYSKPKNEIWVCYFWATWCLNCVRSHEILAGLDKELNNQHIRLISLSLDNKKRKWEEFIQTHPASWEQTYAADTPFDKKFRKNFGSMPNLPQLFIIKRDGKPYKVKYLNQLKGELQKILEEEK